MTVLRFFLTLFLFICLLAGSSVLVAAACLTLRFPPLLFAVVLGCVLLVIVLKMLRRRHTQTAP
ncbi:hypothetical protein [Pseudomonas sp. ACM7]|uniref:hypothetical protein n=1 Tax=Pseudomonas sp. ACM7 TaxID=2052956 RepID=UPI001013358E|nr:hypothetical protein [Pseudomonas sp. ACM7]QAY89980.1 hypothetical protein CUN63_08555 [Pseudomonas sp. ACM7]